MRPILPSHLTDWAGKAHDLRPKCLIYEVGDYTPPVHKDDHARSWQGAKPRRSPLDPHKLTSKYRGLYTRVHFTYVEAIVRSFK